MTAAGGGRATALREAEARLRALALSYPEAREEFPWGERVVKVRRKVFLFLGGADGELSVTVKLPGSATLALDLPFAEPTGYGLARSGWVTARFGPRDRPPLPLLARWVEESYRAVAPKRLAALVTAAAPEQELTSSAGLSRQPRRRRGSRGSAARRAAAEAPARAVRARR